MVISLGLTGQLTLATTMDHGFASSPSGEEEKITT